MTIICPYILAISFQLIYHRLTKLSSEGFRPVITLHFNRRYKINIHTDLSVFISAVLKVNAIQLERKSTGKNTLYTKRLYSLQVEGWAQDLHPRINSLVSKLRQREGYNLNMDQSTIQEEERETSDEENIWFFCSL